MEQLNVHNGVSIVRRSPCPLSGEINRGNKKQAHLDWRGQTNIILITATTNLRRAKRLIK